MVNEIGDVCEVGCFLASLWCSSAHKGCTQFSHQLSSLPKSASGIPEALDLTRWLPKTCRNSDHDPITRQQFFQAGMFNDFVLRLWRCPHSSEHTFIKGFLHLIFHHFHSFCFNGLSNLICHLLDVAIGGVVHYTNLALPRDLCRFGALHCISKLLSLKVRHLQLHFRWLSAAITSRKGAGTPRTCAVDLVDGEHGSASLITKWHIHQSMMSQARKSLHVGKLLPAILGASTDKGPSGFTRQ
mmetsp:Transcript_69717/g.110131  ORF Transcript_69717/g.110131 Transcript_69717/m.110131 type:complete len:242 (-) Transcript_69717:543-1268(-)